MILLIADYRAQLLANGRNPDADHMPLVKLFNPLGPGVWLAAMLEEDGDRLWGLANFDLDCVEYGPFSLAELASLKVGLGLGIERDILFEMRTRRSIWLKVADEASGIRAAERILAQLERDHES